MYTEGMFGFLSKNSKVCSPRMIARLKVEKSPLWCIISLKFNFLNEEPLRFRAGLTFIL